MMHTQLRRFIKKALGVLGSRWVIFGAMFSAIMWLGVGMILDVPNSWRFMVSLCHSLLILLICCALRHAQKQQMRAIERKYVEVMKGVEHAAAKEGTYSDDRMRRMTDTRKSRVPPYSLN
jgi:low affinity Fe/Cu permease